MAVVIGNRQAEGRRTPRNRPTDPAHADNAELLAADAMPQHAGRAPAGPGARPHQLLSLGQPPGD